MLGQEVGVEGTGRVYLLMNDNIITIGVILLFVLFTFVLYRSRIVFLYRFSTFFSSRQIYAPNEIKTSEQELVDIITLILIGCLSVSVIFYSDFIYAEHSGPRYDLLSYIFICITLYIVAKWLIYSLINWTFFNTSKGQSWTSAVFFSIAVVSTIAFPLSLLQIYLSIKIFDITFCIVAVVILQKILLLLKLYVNFRPQQYGCVLFFLYFCSVEIMPPLIVWRILKEMTLQ